MKNKLKITLLYLITALVSSSMLPSAKADEWNKETIVTFGAPVEVPGKVLPAGKYVFKLADSDSNRSIVQIFTADQNELLVTILGIPTYRLDPTGETTFAFEERPAGSPEAMRKWFYPGETSGVEFVYPARSPSGVTGASQPDPAAGDLPLPPQLEPEVQEVEEESLVVIVIPLPER